jgi:hypothetical protein
MGSIYWLCFVVCVLGCVLALHSVMFYRSCLDSTTETWASELQHLAGAVCTAHGEKICARGRSLHAVRA